MTFHLAARGAQATDSGTHADRDAERQRKRAPRWHPDEDDILVRYLVRDGSKPLTKDTNGLDVFDRYALTEVSPLWQSMCPDSRADFVSSTGVSTGHAANGVGPPDSLLQLAEMV